MDTSIEWQKQMVVPTKQCWSIISICYISYLLAAHSEKPGVYKVKLSSISKPVLLCRDYQIVRKICEIVRQIT